MHSGARSDIDDIVTGTHGIFVMLYDNDGISDVAQALQSCYQLIVVALVKSDTRFIKDIHDADERRTYLCCKSDTLCLSARKRSRAAGKGEIFQSNRLKKSEASVNFLSYFLRNSFFFRSERQRVHKGTQLGYRHMADFIYISAADCHSKRFVLETLSAAGRAGDVFHEIFVIFALLRAVDRHVVTAFYYRKYALKARFSDDTALAFQVAVQQNKHCLIGIILERCMNIKTVMSSEGVEHIAGV